jgi:hypothetical protein
MAGDKRILIDLLLETSDHRIHPSDLHSTSELLRAALLLNSSNSPRSCTLVDGIAYATTTPTTTTRQGLAVADTLLSDLFDRLAHPIPPALAEREPDLTPDDWRAAMRVVALILRAFEHAAASDDGH